MNELSSEKTATTKELAEVLGVDVDTVNNTVKQLVTDLKLGFSEILRKSTGGRPTKVFTEEQATLIKQEIQKHHNLASRQIDNVTTDTEMMMNIQRDFAWLVQKNKELQAKADFYDCVTGSKDTVDMKECARFINFRGWGRNKIF